jgi:hypothetical protein
MMSDIVERLRKYKTNGDPTKYTAFATVAEIHEAAAEIVRLREALEEIRDYPNHIPLGIAKMRDIARAALKGQP